MKTLLEKIHPFCSTDETRPHLLKPFVKSGFVYATDGRHIVRAATELPDENPDAAKVEHVFKTYTEKFVHHGGAIFRPLPDIPPEEKYMVTCEECWGNGRYFCYAEIDGVRKKVEHKCDNCDGVGEFNEAKPTSVDIASQLQGARESRFNVALLHHVKDLGADVQIAVLFENDPLWFKVDGIFEGFVMPIRRKD